MVFRTYITLEEALSRFNNQQKRHSTYAGPLETFYYELKPVLLIGLAIIGLSSQQIADPLVKFNVLTLFFLGAYFSYARLLYRGYLK